MSFRFEEDMLPPVRAWLQRRCPLVKEEFRVPWGYCDLVGCAIDARSARQRLSLNQRAPIGPLSRVSLLWHVPEAGEGESAHFDDLLEVFDGVVEHAWIERELAVLEERNFVRRTDGGGFQRLNGWYPLHSRMIAVELKLHRVEEALQQAARHVSFADASYVALPRALAENVSKGSTRRYFDNHAVGLLGISEKWCTTLIEPEKNEFRDVIVEAHCTERFWRDYLTDS